AVTITDVINGQTYTRTVTNGDSTTLSRECPNSGTVVITDTVDGTTYTRTVTNGEGTSIPCPTAVTITDTINGETYTRTVCDADRCQQESNSAICLVDCSLRVQFGIFGGTDNGAIYYIDTEDDFKATRLFESRSTGTVWSIAVNRKETEMKASGGYVYKGQPQDYWLAQSPLDSGNNLDAYGSRKDGTFIYGSASRGGRMWVHAADSTDRTEYTFTNNPSNSVKFCSGYYYCILDIALDGDNYAWVNDAYGNLFISEQPQTTEWGGPMKYIGKISYFPGGSVWGIAFDAKGYVYYGGANSGSTYGWIVRAPVATPLETTLVYSNSASTIGDLASCAYPKAHAAEHLAKA
ncbi:hypothetical protein BGW38_003967, partial [Lunasporangiospora selenospora]